MAFRLTVIASAQPLGAELLADRRPHRSAGQPVRLFSLFGDTASGGVSQFEFRLVQSRRLRTIHHGIRERAEA